jgi:hypothetical protein
VPVSRRFSVRVIQMDYYLTRNANAVNDHQNNFPVGADCVSVVPLEIKRGGSVRRCLRQNLAEAARDDYVFARFQHPDTHHDLIGVSGNASARLRGTRGGI